MAAEENSSTLAEARTCPTLPSDFWSQLEIQQACREQHFGHLLKSYRELQEPPLRQSELASLLSLTQGQVSRIERGVTPVTDLRKLGSWAAALNIPESILWFRRQHSSKQRGGSTHVAATSSANDSSKDDVRKRECLQSVGVGATLVGTSGVQEPPLPSMFNAPVAGTESVEIMRMYLQTFRRIDNRYGGGHSLPKISEYLRDDVVPKINAGAHDKKFREALFATAAELYHLAGWSSYDTENSEQGRKCLSRAIQLCQEVNNKAYLAEMLAGLSHQYSFLKMPENAVDFALASKETANKVGISALSAEASAMAAHGYAQQGDKRSCLRELQNAEADFCRVRQGETPDWLAYFDQAYLAAKFGHALRDLGESSEAERFCRRALDMTTGYERGRMFNTALLASTLADQGRVAEATEQGKRAVQLAGTVRSARSTTYLSDVAESLRPYREDNEVRELYKTMSRQQVPLQRV